LLGAVGDDVGTEMAAPAYMQVVAVISQAAGELVVVEAHYLALTQFSVGVSRRTDTFSVV